MKRESSIQLVKSRKDATAFRTEAELENIVRRLDYDRPGDRRQLIRVQDGDVYFLSVSPYAGHPLNMFIRVTHGTPTMENHDD